MDEEPIDPHGECRAEIERLTREVAALREVREAADRRGCDTDCQVRQMADSTPCDCGNRALRSALARAAVAALNAALGTGTVTG